MKCRFSFLIVLMLSFVLAGISPSVAQEVSGAEAAKRQAIADGLGRILDAGGAKVLGGAAPALGTIIANAGKLSDPCGNGIAMISAIVADSREQDPTGSSYTLLIKDITGGMDPLSISTALTAEVGGQLASIVKNKRLRPSLLAYVRSLKILCKSDLWTTTYGDMLLPKTVNISGEFHTTYPEDGGRIIGKFDPAARTFTGIWTENGSAKTCDTKASDGRLHWGPIRFQFNAAYNQFKGRWGYCSDEPSDGWNGSKK